MTKKALIIGCGDMGLRSALLLAKEGYDVYGAKRRNNLPAPVKFLALDVTDAGQMDSISNRHWDVVLITLTARGEDNYQRVYVQGIANVLNALSGNPLVIFASSASVYSQNDGSVVDESSATKPTGFSGKTMLQAEALIYQSAFPASSVRFGGLYGGGANNHLLAQLQSGHICPEEPVRYSNRIQIDDAARLLVHLVLNYSQGEKLEPVYLASDGNAATLREIMEWLANREGVDITTLAEDYVPKRGGNRRYSNRLMCETGFRLNYPSFREGFLLTTKP